MMLGIMLLSVGHNMLLADSMLYADMFSWLYCGYMLHALAVCNILVGSVLLFILFHGSIVMFQASCYACTY